MMSPFPTNQSVANYLQTSQFQPGHSEFECGAFAVSVNGRASAPGTNNPDNPGRVIQWAEFEYAKTTGSNTPSNEWGATIDQMHIMLKDTQKPDNSGCHPPNVLHYWDMPISNQTPQAQAVKLCRAALEHGYPVIATVPEQSVFDMGLGNIRPYWWGPAGNHIITLVGVTPGGNFLVVDPANVIKGDGNLQTPKQVQSWPREYNASQIQILWATIVQQPWLPGIPSNDPTQWDSNPTPPPVPIPPTLPAQVDHIICNVDNSLSFFDKNNTLLRRVL